MKPIKEKSAWAAGASILALGLMSTPAIAQDQDGSTASDAEDAQITLSKITVSAQKREEGLQDVPLSVQTVSGDDLLENNLFDLGDVADRLPNVTFSTTPAFPSIYIRGAGTGSVNPSAEQSVGMFIDGVYVSRGFQFSAPFLDMERLEVLKGPQGVLQGKNSIAGAVLINTKRPGDESEGYLRAGYEIENEGYNLEGAVTLPITDRWSVRLAGQHNFEGGWIDTTSRTATDGTAIQGREDQNTDEFTVVRLSSTFEASENLDLFGKIEVGESKRTGASFGAYTFQPGAALPTGLPLETFFGLLDPNFGLITDGISSNGTVLELNPTTNQFQATNRERFQDVSNVSGLFQFDWDIGDAGTLTGITGYTDYEVQNASSNTMTPTDWLAGRSRPGENAEEASQFTQEIRLVSPGGQTLDYVVGGFYMDRTITRDGGGSLVNISNSFLNNIFAPAIAPIPTNVLDFEGLTTFEENTEALALFGQLTWNVTDDLRLNAGGRYSDETKDVDFNVIVGFPTPSPFNAIGLGIFGVEPFTTADLPVTEISEDSFDPSLSVQYDLTDDVMIYGSWTQATKAGGFNEGANNTRTVTFDPETATGLEAGLKGSFVNDRLEFNLAVFQTEFEDLQVSALDTASAAPTFIFQNAAEATSQGFEADVRFAASNELELGGAIGYLDATYDDFPGAGCANGVSQEANCVLSDPTDPTSPLSRNAAGDSLRFAPEWTGNVYADYRKRLGNGMTLGLRGDVKYRDDAFIAATNDPFLVQDAFTKVDLVASLTGASGAWTASIVGKNVTDEATVSFAGPTPFFDGAYWSNLEAPRRVYLNLQLNF